MGDYRDEREAALRRVENLAQENAKLQTELDSLRRGRSAGPATTRLPLVFAGAVAALVLLGAGIAFFSVARRPGDSTAGPMLELRGTWSAPAPVGRVPLHGAVRAGTGTWAVGARGTILFRSDPQAPWTTIPSGTDADLHAVVGAAPLLAVGDRGTALLFDPAQRRWIPEPTGVTADLRAATAYNGSVFVAGSGGTVLRRTPAGEWSAIPSSVSANLHGIAVSQNSFGVLTAVGERGTIVSGETTGSTLHAQASPVTVTLRAVAAWNGTLLAVGDLGTAVTAADQSPWTVVRTGVSNDLFVASVAEVPYEERRANFVGSGSSVGFVAAGAAGTVLAERLGSTAGWHRVRAGGPTILAMAADPWTFFTDGGTAIEFSSR